MREYLLKLSFHNHINVISMKYTNMDKYMNKTNKIQNTHTHEKQNYMN